ncbi:MAG TPA: hypothetical protein VHX13_08125 [Acidobacteriaceae bacterium]|jgi:hypothetical protein|nr:hypothetical protein [Acidobacteriaceae bacterium]
MCSALPARAQYPGRVDTTRAAGGPHLRATAVVEYTGDLNHMKSSRLIPIAVWDGLEFQPGALYLAQPAPLAVLPGTQYELEATGRSKGFFNVSNSESLAGLWIGVGHYQAPQVRVARLQPAKVMPYVVGDTDPDKPHFAHRPADEHQPQRSAGAAPIDPDRPSLHERPPSDDASASGAAAEDTDSDRPTFHRQNDTMTNTSAGNAETPIDPNRPRLEYTAPQEQEKLDRPDALLGLPADLNQIVGVSDPKTTDSESWTFSASNPNDAAKMKADLETVAEQALAPPPPAPAPAKSRTAHHSARTKKPVAPPAPMLTDEEFKVYSLSFGGGATMVLSARTTSAPIQYVTIIAQPDFYGNAQILLKHVTRDGDLDVSPRMRLIDAVDPRGDGRADLLFELRGRTFRQFALYRIGGGQASQDFVTEPSAN